MCLETRLEFFYPFLNIILFKDANDLVDVIRKLAPDSTKEDGIFIVNINPLMNTLLILGIFRRFNKDFLSLKMTIHDVSESLVEHLVEFIDDLDHYTLEKLLRYKNSNGDSGLDLIGEFG